jgi:hypothetical protein
MNNLVFPNANFNCLYTNATGAVTFRKRSSTALHALASETPTAKSKAHSHTEFGEAGP